MKNVLSIVLFEDVHLPIVTNELNRRHSNKGYDHKTIAMNLSSLSSDILDDIRNKDIFHVMFLHDVSISEEDLKIKLKPFFDHYSGLKPLYPNLTLSTFKVIDGNVNVTPASLPFKCEGMDVKKFLSIYEGNK